MCHLSNDDLVHILFLDSGLVLRFLREKKQKKKNIYPCGPELIWHFGT